MAGLEKIKIDKKIAFVNTSQSWGGLEMNVIRLANWLISNGIDINLFCLESSPVSVAANKYNIPVVYVKKHHKYFDVFKAKILYNLLNKLKIDVVFIFDNRDLSTVAIAKFFSKKKIKIIFQQQMLIAGNKKDIFHRWHHSLVDKWISPLNILKKQVLKYTTIHENKIKIIPLGVNIQELLKNKISKEAARKQLNISDNVVLVGIIGRIDKLKGQDFLIETIYKLRQKKYNIELLVAGEPTKEKAGEEYNKYVSQLVERYELNKYVHFYSFFENVGVLYSALDIFALSTQNETFGMVTVEAMLFSKAIIATNTGGTPEILDNGKFGILYKNRDLEDFLTKIKILIEDENLRIEMGNRANIEAMSKYSHEFEVNKILDILRNI